MSGNKKWTQEDIRKLDETKKYVKKRAENGLREVKEAQKNLRLLDHLYRTPGSGLDSSANTLLAMSAQRRMIAAKQNAVRPYVYCDERFSRKPSRSKPSGSKPFGGSKPSSSRY